MARMRMTRIQTAPHTQPIRAAHPRVYIRSGARVAHYQHRVSPSRVEDVLVKTSPHRNRTSATGCGSSAKPTLFVNVGVARKQSKSAPRRAAVSAKPPPAAMSGRAAKKTKPKNGQRAAVGGVKRGRNTPDPDETAKRSRPSRTSSREVSVHTLAAWRSAPGSAVALRAGNALPRRAICRIRPHPPRSTAAASTHATLTPPFP